MFAFIFVACVIPFSSHLMPSLYNAEFSIPSALIGNRLHLLRVSFHCYAETFWRIRCASATELSALFLGELDSQQTEDWISTLENLCLSSYSVTSLIALRIDSENGNLFLICDHDGAMRKLLLRKLNDRELNEHLFSVINEKTRYMAEKIIRVATERKLRVLQAELSPVKEMAKWQEQEIELLKILLKSSTTSDLVADKSVSCSCPSSIQKRSADSAPLSDLTPIKVNVSDEDEPMIKQDFLKELNHGASPIVVLPAKSFSNTQQTPNFLMGIVQYILCQLCPEQTPDFMVMEDHFLRTHVNKEKRNYEACPSEDQPDLIQHMRRHINSARHVVDASLMLVLCVVIILFILERKSTAVRSAVGESLARITSKRI